MNNVKKDNVLIIEDDNDMRELISKFLIKKGLNVESVSNGDDGFDILNTYRPKVIIADLYIQNSTISGITMIELLKKKSPMTSIIVISGHTNMRSVIENLKVGIYDFLEKPFNYYKLYSSVIRAFESYHINQENKLLKHQKLLVGKYVGESNNAIRVHKFMYRTSKTPCKTYIYGSRGLGKESIARTIHSLSEYKDGNFVKYLFPTDTDISYDEFFIDSYNKKSILSEAQCGTLFIDNVETLSLKIQNELAKILNDNYYKNYRTNSFEEININFILCGLEDPISLLNAGKLSQELYLTVSNNIFNAPNITLMKEDFALFIKKITQEITSECAVKPRIFSSEAVAFLQLYNWKGGFRELKAIVEKVLVYNNEEGPVNTYELMKFMKLDEEHEEHMSYTLNHFKNLDNENNKFNLQIDLSLFAKSSLKELRTYCEVQFIKMQMQRFNNNISKTASAIEMERSALHRKLKSLGIHISE